MLKQKKRDNQTPAPQTENSPPKSDPPDTWEELVLRWALKKRWRSILLIAAVLVGAILIIWRAVPEKVQVDIIENLGFGEPEDDVLPEATPNLPADWHGIERQDTIDLDLFQEVPPQLRDHRVSPTLRIVDVKLLKMRMGTGQFSNWQFSSRIPIDSVCLSGQTFEFRQVTDMATYGAQLLHRFELLVNLATAPLGQPIEVKWQTVSWNKYQEKQNWWTSILVDIAYDRLVMTVDFPVESGIDVSHVTAQSRPIGVADWAAVANPRLSEAEGGKIVWDIGAVVPGREYAIFWDIPVKSLGGTRTSDPAFGKEVGVQRPGEGASDFGGQLP